MHSGAARRTGSPTSLDNQPDPILGMRRGCRVLVAVWVCDYDVVVLGCGVR